MKRIPGTNVYEIENHSIWSMARIGEFHCNTLFSVRVYSGEGDIPHFHIVDVQNGNETCIRIDVPEYFLHGDKTFTLNSKQKKKLIEFLNTVSEYEEDCGKTYYELIWEEWNRNNREHRIPKPEVIPDYERL